MSSPSSTLPQDEELDASLYPIAILLDELKHEDTQLRLNATRRIKTIAEALGPERTRGELLPFITETIDDEDEVVLILAEELGDFLTEVGGSAHAAVLVDPLESLCTVEETVIRDRAVESLRRLSAQVTAISDTDARTLHVDHIFPLLQRLGAGDWFTSRISACSLCSLLYERLPAECDELRAEVLSLYKTLSRDETPMVRRAAASNIAKVARALHEVSPPHVTEELLSVFGAFVSDDQDSVRLLAVEHAAAFASLISNPRPGDSADTVMSSDPNGSVQANEKKEQTQVEGKPPTQEKNDASALNDSATSLHGVDQIVDMIKEFAQDKSWRVRYMLADQLGRLCDALGPEATRSDLLPAYLTVLKDNESEVRTAAAFKIAEVVQRIVALPTKPGETAGLDHAVFDIMPLVEQLVTDTSQHVRAALASNLIDLPPVLGAEVTINHMVEFVLALLKDEYPEVRLNVIGRLDKVSLMMSPEKLSEELLPVITDLAEDKNWRVRLAIIDHVPRLAKQLGKDFFEVNKKLRELCISWLGDCVYSIREAAIKNLKALTEIFGLDWAKEHIVPQVLQMYDRSTNYLLRMTSLHAIGILAEVVNTETVEESFLPIVTERASRDPVPNVRFCSAKTLNLVIPYVRQDIRESKIRPCLLTLVDSSEKDKDVNYFAQQALYKLGTCPS